jgi:hypothetical protein
MISLRGGKMRSRRILISLMFLTCMILLAACTSSVKRGNLSYDYKYAGEKFNKIEVSLNSEVRDRYKGKTLFDSGRLSWAVKRNLKEKGLFSDLSENLIEIVMTNMRTRSHFSAEIFGFMAGADRLEGDVLIKDVKGAVLNNFRVSATYALGGNIAGNDDIRMEWLYTKFGQLIVQNILNK